MLVASARHHAEFAAAVRTAESWTPLSIVAGAVLLALLAAAGAALVIYRTKRSGGDND